MLRKIIVIDEEKCNGCGLCAKACHEGAIAMVNGKAKLVKENHCDGLGDCLPACPVNAISFEEKEAAAYDKQAVEASKAKVCSCPSTSSKNVKTQSSQLKNWPPQIKLMNISAPYLEQAHLLIAADCCAYAYGNFHQDFMQDKITLIGCPKLDNIDYADKLTEIIKSNNIQSITVTRMTVPCCGGITQAIQKAIHHSGKNIPLKIYNISLDGKIEQK